MFRDKGSFSPICSLFKQPFAAEKGSDMHSLFDDGMDRKLVLSWASSGCRGREDIRNHLRGYQGSYSRRMEQQAAKLRIRHLPHSSGVWSTQTGYLTTESDIMNLDCISLSPWHNPSNYPFLGQKKWHSQPKKKRQAEDEKRCEKLAGYIRTLVQFFIFRSALTAPMTQKKAKSVDSNIKNGGTMGISREIYMIYPHWN